MKPKLLVLDDQLQYLRSLERALRQDFDVVLATTLSEANENISDSVALVLADVRLDERNDRDRTGLNFIQQSRSRYPYLPIVAMSALDASDVDRAAISAGASRFLRKPIVLSELRKLIGDLIRKRP
jgi:DNA-binding NtrC family response regulator